MGQDGNVYDLMESAFDGVNDSSSETHTIHSGDWGGNASSMVSSARTSVGAVSSFINMGFRVAVIPEPTSALLLLGSGAMLLLRRRRASAL